MNDDYDYLDNCYDDDNDPDDYETGNLSDIIFHK